MCFWYPFEHVLAAVNDLFRSKKSTPPFPEAVKHCMGYRVTRGSVAFLARKNALTEGYRNRKTVFSIFFYFFMTGLLSAFYYRISPKCLAPEEEFKLFSRTEIQ